MKKTIRLTESEFRNILNQSVQDILNESRGNGYGLSDNELKESIRPIVRECVKESYITEGKIKISNLVKKLMQNDEFKKKAWEYLNKNKDYNGWSEQLQQIGDKKYTTLDNLSDGSKRRIVTQRLKDQKIDFAPIAYKLWPDMTQDAARSWFSKKVAGKKVSFTDEEISQIFSLLNNTIS